MPDDKRPLKFNLKWDEAEQSRTKVQYFVSQAVLQAAVEAAAIGVKRENITFNISNPEAYNADHLRSYKRITSKDLPDAQYLYDGRRILSQNQIKPITLLQLGSGQ